MCMVKIMKFKMCKQELYVKIRYSFSSEQSCSFETCYTAEYHMDCFFTSLQAFSRDYSNN